MSDAVRDVLAPYRAVRVALLGAGNPGPDLHLLVEFSSRAPAIALADWLRMQRELRVRCGCTVELVSVNRLEERVASEATALTILYDAASDA